MPVIVKPDIPEAPGFSPRMLRAARRQAGLTLDDLAARLGRQRHTVMRYEHGEAVPSVAVLGPLAHVLGVPIDALFEVDSPRSALPIDDPDLVLAEVDRT